MIRLTSRRNDRENRRRRPFPGLVHTPGTPLLHHLGGATDGAASLRAPRAKTWIQAWGKIGIKEAWAATWTRTC